MASDFCGCIRQYFDWCVDLVPFSSRNIGVSEERDGIWMPRLFDCSAETLRERISVLITMRNQLPKAKLLRFFEICLAFFKKHLSPRIFGSNVSATIKDDNIHLLWIEKTLCNCISSITDSTQAIGEPFDAEISEFGDKLKRISAETAILLPKEWRYNNNKKRIRENEEEGSEDSPRKKRKTKHCNPVVLKRSEPWAFFPVELDANKIAHAVDLSFIETDKGIDKKNLTQAPGSPLIEKIAQPLSKEEKEHLKHFIETIEESIDPSSVDLSLATMGSSLEVLFGPKSEESLAMILDITEDALKRLTNIVIKYESLSYFQILQFVKQVFYPRVSKLTKPASRVLLSTLLLMCDHQPKQIVEGLLLELLRSDSDQSILNKFHVEILQRILNESVNKKSPALVDQFLQSFLNDKFVHQWEEITIHFMFGVISQKFALSHETIDSLLHRLLTNSEVLGSKLKFSSLMSNLLVKYPTDIAQNKDLFAKIVAHISPKMQQSLLNRLKKL